MPFIPIWHTTLSIRPIRTVCWGTVGIEKKIVDCYRTGVSKGMLKVLAKMGISTLQSYKGAQIFEAIGLNSEPIDLCFTGTLSRIKGVGFDVLADESIRRHELGFPSRESADENVLPNQGEFHWRQGGESHAWSPYTISEIQQAARQGDKDAYSRFSNLVNEESVRMCTLRGLLKFKKKDSIPLEEVEPASEIVKRMCTGAHELRQYLCRSPRNVSHRDESNWRQK